MVESTAKINNLEEKMVEEKTEEKTEQTPVNENPEEKEKVEETPVKEESKSAAPSGSVPKQTREAPKGGLLQSASVYVRLRPAVTGSGTGHDMDGAAVAKTFDGYTKKSVTLGTTMMFSKGKNKYNFMKSVLTPEFTQQDVWDEFMPNLVDDFTMKNGRNVFLLAYG
jgi:hypothetical protein